MGEVILFWLYLLALIALPILAQWRWGVLVALAVVLLELLAVPLVFYVLDVNKLIPTDHSGLPDSPIARFRDQQARGFGVAIAWLMISGTAVLLGGGIAVVWAAIAGGWRRLARRSREGLG
jgi:hypothetical protein